MFHDDGRFFKEDGKRTGIFTLYQTNSADGGLTWSRPVPLYRNNEIHLCEPGIIRSPDGNQLAALLRENSRTKNSHVIFSNDEGKSWSSPAELPRELTGDRHTGNIWLMAGSFYLSGIQRPAVPLKEIGSHGSGPMTILFPQIPASFGSGSRIINMSGIVATLV